MRRRNTDMDKQEVMPDARKASCVIFKSQGGLDFELIRHLDKYLSTEKE